jgi:hypothetical protein
MPARKQLPDVSPDRRGELHTCVRITGSGRTGSMAAAGGLIGDEPPLGSVIPGLSVH